MQITLEIFIINYDTLVQERKKCEHKIISITISLIKSLEYINF
jgi:hypothetical protein